MDCWVIHHPPLDFHGAGGKGRRPWLCKHASSSKTGADGPQAEERAIAADAHRIARVPCDEFLFFDFLAEALKKNTVCPVEKKRSRQISKCTFLFDQSYFIAQINLRLSNRLVNTNHLNLPRRHFSSVFRSRQDLKCVVWKNTVLNTLAARGLEEHTTSPVTIENLPRPELHFRAAPDKLPTSSRQAPDKLPTTSVLFNVGIVEILSCNSL